MSNQNKKSNKKRTERSNVSDFSHLNENTSFDISTCKVCNQKMQSNSSSTTTKVPRVLPCLHTFCENCLKDISTKGNNGEIFCPNCENKCKKSIHELPINYDVIKKIELLSIQSNPTYCDNCKENVLAEYQCNDCSGLLMCEVHKSIHKERKPNHSIISLNDPTFENHLNSNLFSVKCNKEGHEKDQIDYYCENCNKLLCLRCVVEDHPKPQHNYLRITEAAKKYKPSIDKLFEQTNSKVPMIDDSIDQVKQAIAALELKFKEVENQIKQETEKLIQSINERAKRLFRQLEEIKEEKKLKLENQLKLFQNNRNNFQSSCDFTKSALDGIKNINTKNNNNNNNNNNDNNNDNNSNSSNNIKNNNNHDKSGELHFVLFKESITEKLNGICKFMNENLEICENSEIELISYNSSSLSANFMKSIEQTGEIIGSSKKIEFDRNFCCSTITLSGNNLIATRISGYNGSGGVLGTIKNPKSFKVQLLASPTYGSFYTMIGLAPKQNFKVNSGNNFSTCGWYLYCVDGSLYSQNGDSNRRYLGTSLRAGQIIEVQYDEKNKRISYKIDGIDRGVAFQNVNNQNLDLYPAFDNMYQTESIQLIQ